MLAVDMALKQLSQLQMPVMTFFDMYMPVRFRLPAGGTMEDQLRYAACLRVESSSPA